MEFLSFDDGVIRVERYRDDVSPSRRRKNAKVKPFRDVSGAGINSESSQNYCLMPHKVPFAFQPQKALFKDFDIGKTYSITVTLTNVTKGFSTFRAMPISPIYSDILDVDYIPPPRISAGLSWKLKINFRPVEERNISTELHLKSECGSFYVPIRIQRKRAVISIDPQKVDFGTVVIGETRRKKIVIRNDGASCGSIHIAGTFRKVAEGMQVDPLTKQERSFLTINPLMYRVEVPPFSHREFELSFSPVEEVDLNCNIIFSDRTEGEKNFTIPIKGKATSLPVHVASEDLQMNWCFYGCTYSSDIILSNTSNVSAIASPEVDRSLREVIRFDPPLACVQPGGEFRIAVFFTPNEDLDSDFETTVDLHVKGQSLPATVKMFASLTKRQPDVSADSVSVGRSFINEEKLVTIDVSNASSLPQMVGFLNIPANVRITPDVATMLPLENMEFKICVTAPSFGQYAQQLTLYNEYGDRRTIKLSGYGVEPKLLFSDSTISLPPCAINSSVTATTVLTNTSLEARQFAFMVGCDFIRISPSSGSLKPGESIPIVIFFIALPLPSPAPVEKIPVVAPPPKSLKRRKSNAKAQAQLPPAEPIETVQTKVSTYEDWNASEDCPWSRHKNIIIRCVSSGLEEEQYYLQLMCTVVKPDLVGRTILFVKPPVVIDQPTGRKKSGKISKKEEPAPVNPLDAIEVSPPSCSLYVDFGEVSLNRATVQTCFIRNDGGAQLSLQLRPVDPLSPFTVIKLPKSPLDQGEEEAILIQFMPTEYGTYSDIITFATDSSNSVDVYVYGACCCTELAISFDGSIDPTVASKPESIDSIQFATTKKGDACQVPLWFYNFGTFPLDVSIQVADPENTDWILKRTLFFQPSMFSIPPNGKLSAAAIFCPQQDGEYSVEAKVKAGGYEHKLLLDARGSSSGVYCVFPKDDRWSEVITGEHSCVIRRPPSFGRSVDYPLSLHFLTGETKTFTIGSVKMGPPVECVIEKWDESFAAVGWVVEPMKLTVLAGAQGTLRVTLRQPDQSRKILVPYCLFAITLKCSVDPSNDRTYYVRCTGP